MKYLLSFLLLLYGTVYGQCLSSDTCTNNTATVINSTTVTLSTTPPDNPAYEGVTLVYVRVGFTDSIIATGSELPITVGGLRAGYTYKYYFRASCSNGPIYQTVYSTFRLPLVYTPMTAAGYEIKNGKFDEGLALPNTDSVIGRQVNRPGLILYKTNTGLVTYNGEYFEEQATRQDLADSMKGVYYNHGVVRDTVIGGRAGIAIYDTTTGGGSGIPTFQQVLTAGNTATGSFSLNEGSSRRGVFYMEDGAANVDLSDAENDPEYIAITGTDSGYIKFVRGLSSTTQIRAAGTNTTNKVWLPDSTGVLGQRITVNGTTYDFDSKGRIDLGTIGGAGPWLVTGDDITNTNTGNTNITGNNIALNAVDVISLEAGLAGLNGLDSVAIVTPGPLRIDIPSKGATKVLTSDANGYATWQTPTVFSTDSTIYKTVFRARQDSAALASETNTKLSITTAAATYATITNLALKKDKSDSVGNSGFTTLYQLNKTKDSINNLYRVIKQFDTTSITIRDTTNWLIVNPNVVVTSQTITLPVNPVDGKSITISFGGLINAASAAVVNTLTIAPNSGQSIVGATIFYALEAGDRVIIKYNSTNSKWYYQ